MNNKNQRIVKTTALMLFLNLLLLSAVNAQIGIDETVVPKTPAAATFDKIDFTPTDLATGGAGISFKIYDLKTNSFEIPLMLQYHSGGIQVNESPTWVGLGWTLDMGGCISRNIQGNPDEGIYLQKERKYYLISSTLGPINNFPYWVPYNYDTSSSAKNYFINFYQSRNQDYGTLSVGWEDTNPRYKSSVLYNLSGKYTSNYLFQGLNTYPKLYTEVLAADADAQKAGLPSTDDEIYTQSLVDPSPDEFTLKIPGYTGKFYINTQGVPTLNPIDRDLKITYIAKINENNDNKEPYIDTWIVSSSDGKQYYFGYGDSSKSYSVRGYGYANAFTNEPIIGWNMTKIVDINTKDSIVFKYKIIASQLSFLNDHVFKAESFADVPAPSYSLDKIHYTQESVATQVIGTNEVINFFSSEHLSTAWVPRNIFNSHLLSSNFSPCLDSITVFNKLAVSPIARCYFNYGDFALNGKLKLNSFQRISNNLVDVQPPTYFSYYDLAAPLKILSPPWEPSERDSVTYTPFAQDYWGYYNGAQQNYCNFYVMPSGHPGTATRLPNWPSMQEAVLNKITYPQGGQTLINYEPNAAASFFNSNGQLSTETVGDTPFDLDSIGGLRVKKITQLDEKGKTIQVHTYSYTDGNGLSSGQLNITPSVVTRIDDEPLCFTDQATTSYFLLSTYNKAPKHNNAAIVNYSYVTENILDSAGNSNGYTVHQFYNDANLPDSGYLTYYTNSPNKYSFNGLGNMPYWLDSRSLGKNLLNGLEKETDVYDKSSKLVHKTLNEYQVKEPQGYTGFIGGFDLHQLNLSEACSSIPFPSVYNDINPFPAGWTLYATKDSVYLIHKLPPPLIVVSPTHTAYYLRFYAEYSKFLFLSKRTETSFTSTGDSVTLLHKSFYDSPNHYNETKTIDYNSKGDSITTIKLYAFDFAPSIGSDSTCKQMQSLYFNPLIASTTFSGSQIQSGTVTLYQNVGTATNLSFFPSTIYVHHSPVLTTPTNTYGSNNSVSYPASSYFADNNYLQECTEKFDLNGNLIELQKNGADKEALSGVITVNILWLKLLAAIMPQQSLL